jgi:NADH-quinone oxidoreductase subunit D
VSRIERNAQPDVLIDAEGEQLADVLTEELLINMGPQHPSTHGVLRLLLRTDGELVLEVVPHIGYLHRCAEKIGENLTPQQYIPYTDRLDYLSAMNNNLTYALAIERLAGVEVPPRATYIRMIMAELNRIGSHLVTFGCFGMDMGAWTPFLYGFREREHIIDLFEATCGARLTYSYITIGGVTHDLPDGFADACRRFLDYFGPKIDEYDQLLSFNQIFIKRTANVGTVSPEQAIAYGLSGPILRACGVRWDLRRVSPYCFYDRMDFEIPIGQGTMGAAGDSWERYYIRILEMRQSVRIIRQALDQLPDGPVRAKTPRTLRIPPGEIYFETENPRGQLGFYVITDGSPIPYRVKARGPSFCNLCIVNRICRNILVADIPAILGSIDVVMGEVDR